MPKARLRRDGWLIAAGLRPGREDVPQGPAGVRQSRAMTNAPRDVEALRTALAASEARADAMADEAARSRAAALGAEAVIATLRLEVEKLGRALYGRRSERRARLLDQLELQLEELEAAAGDDELAAEPAAPRRGITPAAERRRPARKPFPAHLPRERVVIEAPCACAACGSGRIVKLGEDGEPSVRGRWRARRSRSCPAVGGRSAPSGKCACARRVECPLNTRLTLLACERNPQPPAPFHPTPRGRAGPGFLAFATGLGSVATRGSLLSEKFGQHQPLDRQAGRYAREGVDLSLSTPADQVGGAAAALAPLHALIEARVVAAVRLHRDDTTVPVLVKTKTRTGWLWTYIRDDRPFAGPTPPAALFRCSPDRRGEHPEQHLAGWSGILQADAHAGFGGL